MELHFFGDDVKLISTLPELDENKISLKVFPSAPYLDEPSDSIVFLIEEEAEKRQVKIKQLQIIFSRKEVCYLKGLLESFLNEKV